MRVWFGILGIIIKSLTKEHGEALRQHLASLVKWTLLGDCSEIARRLLPFNSPNGFVRLKCETLETSSEVFALVIPFLQ
jgi:hypothetical protein